MKQSCLPEFTYLLFLQSKQFNEKNHSADLKNNSQYELQLLNMQFLSKVIDLYWNVISNQGDKNIPKRRYFYRKKSRNTDSKEKNSWVSVIEKTDSKKSQNWFKKKKKTQKINWN